MEVHHHAHTARKKWTHYFWEFVMMFLAVFCGFMAENKREHIIENQRATDYARMLIEDLKKDTAELNGVISDNNGILGYIDSLQAIAQRNSGNNRVTGNFYYYSRLATTATTTTWHRSALNQIINSGSVRYFKNKDLFQQISEYDMTAYHISSQQESDKFFRTKSMELRSRLLDNNYFSPLAGIRREDDTNSLLDSMSGLQLPLQINDANLMNEYLNSFQNRKATLSYLQKRNLPRSLETATKLIALLKKEYHLK